jgi:hypothetical protein
MSRFTSLLLAVALMAQPVQAGVMYTWHQVKASSTMPAGLNMELVFSEKAVAGGSLNLDFMNLCDIGEPCLNPQDSLLSLRYWYDDPVYGSAIAHNLIDYGYRDMPRHYGDRIQLEVNFLAGGLLGGSIFASDGNSHFWMESDGALFNMRDANSDEPFGCGYAGPGCRDFSGMLRIEPPQGEVPEPSGAAIAGLGLLAAWFARRRKR